MLSILTEVTGALEDILFSSLNIFAFLAINDLFFFISIISTSGEFISRLKSFATRFVKNIL